MICVKGWKLTNVVYYERAVVKVRAPLVVIRGRNLVSKFKQQNNGAGKSLLCFPVPNILMGAPPISAKKKGRKDILSKKSCAYIDFVSHDNKRIEAYQYAAKYELVEDGKELDTKSIPVAERLLSEYFPLNEQEFYSTVYIRTIPLEFQIGTPSDRLKFLSDLFRLDAYDELKKYFTQRLRQVKDEETKYAVLATSLTKIKKDLACIGWTSEKNSILEDKKLKLEDVQSKLRIISDELHELEIVLVNINVAKDLQTQLADLGYVPTLNVDQKLKALLLLQEDIQEYQTYLRLLDRYKSSTKKLKADLAALNLPKESKQKLIERDKSTSLKLEDQRSKLTELQRTHNMYIECEENKRSLYQELNDLGYKKCKDVPMNDVEHDLAQARTVLGLKRLLCSHGQNKCPTCLSDIDIQAISVNVRQAEVKVKKLNTILSAQGIVRQLKKVPKIDFDKNDLKACKQEVSKLERLLESIQSDLEECVEYERLSEILASISCPEPVNKPQTKHSAQSVARSISALHKMRSLLDSFNRVKDVSGLMDDLDLHLRRVDKKIHDLQETAKSLSSKFNSLTDTVRCLEQDLAQYRLLFANFVDTKQQMADMSQMIEQKQVLEALVGAYGPKGLKIRAIKNVCKMLETNFNVYSQYIYNEDFKFKITVEPTGILVDVDRGNGFCSDVRMLSGAESDCFKLMFLTSLLPLIPSERRVNLLILDEPDSHFDQATRQKFIHDFLPQLMTVVPNIMVITPNDEDEYPEAENWLVTKSGRKSELTID